MSLVYLWIQIWYLLRALSQIVNAANEVINSIDKDELLKFFSVKPDPEDEEAEVSGFWFFLLCLILACRKLFYHALHWSCLLFYNNSLCYDS